jgi:NitT/TauT family transport system permease protein
MQLSITIPGRRSALLNVWDVVAFLLIMAVLVTLSRGARETLLPLASITHAEISLAPSHLPEYALRTTLRMLAAITASLLFTFVYGALAAKSRRAEMVLVPLLDILQSVPVLGFLSFTVTGFMGLFPSRALGVELAAIFAIFTSQAWNMTFSFYQSLRTIPDDLEMATRSFRLTPWQKFWRLEVPFAMPGLVWNTMMSMSGGWFFVVASETLMVGHTQIALPGIGSYVATAIQEQNLTAIAWAVGTMLLVIVAYDQLMFRPLVAWADKFRCEQSSSGEAPGSWFLTLLQRTRLLRRVWRRVPRIKLPARDKSAPPQHSRIADTLQNIWQHPLTDKLWVLMIIAIVMYTSIDIVRFIGTELRWQDAETVYKLGLMTMLRVIVLITLATLIWVPIGVWIGLRPKWAERVQPLAQFLAAFPSNLLFPVFVMLVVRFHLNADIWLSPLMILGTQWYILFNVIAGASAFPNDLRDAATSFHLKGWNWWRKVILPGIFPYYVTGAITASGGAWNASIVAEVVSWGNTTLHAQGLGAYIASATAEGDYPKIVLGVAVMSLFVILFNRILWRPMLTYAERRLRLD